MYGNNNNYDPHYNRPPRQDNIWSCLTDAMCIGFVAVFAVVFFEWLGLIDLVAGFGAPFGGYFH